MIDASCDLTMRNRYVEYKTIVKNVECTLRILHNYVKISQVLILHQENYEKWT